MAAAVLLLGGSHAHASFVGGGGTSGSSAGGVGTSTVLNSSTFPVATSPTTIGNSILNQTGPSIVVTGPASSSISGDGSNSQIQQLNTVYNVPLNYATGGCFGSATTTDFGGCVNRAYLLGNNASSVQINVPAMIVPSSTWLTPIVLGVNGERADIVCVPGEGSELFFGGQTTSTAAITINYGSQSNGVTHAIGEGLNGCNIQGFRTSTTTPQIGVLAGGSFGADGTVLTSLDISGFGKGLAIATNTYNFTLQSSILRNNGNNLYIAPGSNSGESIRMLNDFIVDAANNNPAKCILVDDFGVSSLDFEGGSIDDCQLYLGQQELFVGLYGVHMENPGPQWGRYDFIYATSSAFTNLYLSGGNFVNDSASTSLEYITSGANIVIDGTSAYKNNTATTTSKFINPLAGAYSFASVGFQNINSAVTNLFSNESNCTAAQFEIDKNNAYSFCINQDSSNVTNFVNGNNVQGTLDNNGNWKLNNLIASSSFSALNPKGSTALGVTTTGIPLMLGTSTVPLGGAALILDACTSTVTTIPYALSTSTDAVQTYPQIGLNQAIFQWASQVTGVSANTSTITTSVCTSLSTGGTPTSTRYDFTINRISGM